MLEHYEPRKFFHWFEKITQIPRPSFHEERICDFLESFAVSHQLAYHRDAMHNILMRVPSSVGYENEPPLLLQSHTDMIAEKDDGVTFDFLKDPIRLKVEGNELRAEGTTLGADDAGGMAIMLSIADSPELPHPELELLFTTQEEVGMHGMQAFDLSLIRSRRMINLDCGRMHNISVSSAGSMSLIVEETFTPEMIDGTMISLHISGGIGGHSGLDIHKNRACAANILGELLVEAGTACDLRLASVNTPRGPILGEIEASFVIDASQTQAVIDIIEARFAVIRKRFLQTDPALCLDIKVQHDVALQAVSAYDSGRISKLMYLLRTGDKKHDGENPSIILTSSVINKVVLINCQFSFSYTIRAVEDHDKELYGALAKETLDFLNFSMRISKGYPGWPKRPQSQMVSLFDKVHQRIFGYEPGHQYIHGGIEVGVILGTIPEMDAVGALPSMANAHTPRETLFIDQVPDYWKLITALLAEKS